jgi:hypothetical protein
MTRPISLDVLRTTLATLSTARDDGTIVVNLTRLAEILRHYLPPRHFATTHDWLIAKVEVLRDMVVFRSSPRAASETRALAAELLAGLDR